MRVRFLPSWLLTLSLVLCLGACTFEDATEESEDQQAATPSQPAADPNVISVPSRDYRAYDRAALESGRRDPAWRTYAERDLQERRGGTAAAPQATPGAAGTEPPLTSDFQAETVPPAGAGPEGGAPRPGARAAGQETFDQISPAALQGRITLPVPREEGGPSALRV
ncbi:MAG TPA: hypothetical protein VEL74_18575, partial [Thermoanaerobaculia bacterium]|nr:hypothetical protein [Thermoanaerobaculia bacterium]